MTTPGKPGIIPGVEEYRIGRWLRLDVDRETDAAYIELIDDDVAETRAIDSCVNVRLNSVGYVVGIEILKVDRP
jgi:uncharacterized protein YuzE